MVKGARCGLYAVIFYVTIEYFSKFTAHGLPIKNLVYNTNGLGTYSFEFENVDGTFRKEDGGVVTNTKGVFGLVVRGEYGYVDPDGRQHFVRYVADADGYRPQADDYEIRYNDRRIV